MNTRASRAPRTARRFTEQERAEYRQAKRQEQREQIERATRALLSSDGWRRWVRTRAAFHRYSWHNCALIAMQAPEATQVAGFRRWQELGRQVRSGEKAIRILAPMIVGSRDAHDEDDGEERGGRPVIFRAVPVFDIAQTDGEPLPRAPREPITGDSHRAHLDPLIAHARTLGFTVEREALGPDHGGYCDARRRRIVVSSTLSSANSEVRVLVHELAHAHGVGYKDHRREDAEVIVETAAIIVCGALGLDTSGESIPYIAGWGEANDLQAIGRYAETVDEIASAIEAACGIKDERRSGSMPYVEP
jgi:antirestriction protein ArdC